jgi:hypothetical protein
MKCQACDEAATLHVTEIVAGEPVEHHVCETHFQSLEGIAPATASSKPSPDTGIGAFVLLREAQRNAVARQKMAAHLLPALCLGLLDESAEVRLMSAFWLMRLAPDAGPAVGALQNALRDPDERVRKAATIALKQIDTMSTPPNPVP